MPRPVHVFISSSPDLAAEREALGQAVAELPASVRFEVRHTTPGEDADIDEALAFIAGCDLYVLVLGADYAAPMGIEWQWARDAATSFAITRRMIRRAITQAIHAATRTRKPVANRKIKTAMDESSPWPINHSRAVSNMVVLR